LARPLLGGRATVQRHRRSRKILVATVGAGVVSYVLACGGETITTPTSGNLMPSRTDGSDDAISSGGNLMGVVVDARDDRAEAGADARVRGDATTDGGDADDGADGADADDAGDGRDAQDGDDAGD
jgi:hypothetical protein